MADLVALKAELLAGHPDTGAYNVDDALAAAEINEVNRPNTVDINEIFKFMAIDEVYSTDGSDTQDRSLWQRLKEVVSLAVVPTAATANPWGSTAAGNITEIRQLKCHQLFDFLSLAVQGGLGTSVDLKDSNFQIFLNGAENASVMSLAQKNALLALADNQQSRADELSLGRVNKNAVTQARALP